MSKGIKLSKKIVYLDKCNRLVQSHEIILILMVIDISSIGDRHLWLLLFLKFMMKVRKNNSF